MTSADMQLQSTRQIIESLTINNYFPDSDNIYESIKRERLAEYLPNQYNTKITHNDIVNMRSLKTLSESERMYLVNMADANAYAIEYARAYNDFKDSLIHSEEDIKNIAINSLNANYQEKRIRALYDGINGYHSDTSLGQSMFSAFIRGLLSPIAELPGIIGVDKPSEMLKAITPIGLDYADSYSVKIPMAIGNAAGFLLGASGSARIGGSVLQAVFGASAKTLPAGFRSMVSPQALQKLAGRVGLFSMGYGMALDEVKDALERYYEEERQEVESVLLRKNEAGEPITLSEIEKLGFLERAADGDTRGMEYLISIVPATINMVPTDRLLSRLIRGSNGQVANAAQRLFKILDKNELPKVRASYGHKALFIGSQAGLGGLSEFLEMASTETFSELAAKGRLSTALEAISGQAFDTFLLGAIAEGTVAGAFTALPRFHSPDVEALAQIVEGRDTLISYLASNPEMPRRHRQILEAAQKITNINDLSKLVFGKTYDELVELQSIRPKADLPPLPQEATSETQAVNKPQPSLASLLRESQKESQDKPPTSQQPESLPEEQTQVQQNAASVIQGAALSRTKKIAHLLTDKARQFKTVSLPEDFIKSQEHKAEELIRAGFLDDNFQENAARRLIRRMEVEDKLISESLNKVIREKVKSRLALAVANPAMFQQVGASPQDTVQNILNEVRDEIVQRIGDPKLLINAGPDVFEKISKAAFTTEKTVQQVQRAMQLQTAAITEESVPQIYPWMKKLEREIRRKMISPKINIEFQTAEPYSDEGLFNLVENLDSALRLASEGKYNAYNLNDKIIPQAAEDLSIPEDVLKELRRVALKARLAYFDSIYEALRDPEDTVTQAKQILMQLPIVKTEDGIPVIGKLQTPLESFQGREIKVSKKADRATIETENGLYEFRKDEDNNYVLLSAPQAHLADAVTTGANLLGNISLKKGVLGKIFSPFYSALASPRVKQNYAAYALRRRLAEKFPDANFEVKSPYEYDFKNKSFDVDSDGVIIFNSSAYTEAEISSAILLRNLNDLFAGATDEVSIAYLSRYDVDTLSAAYQYLTAKEAESSEPSEIARQIVEYNKNNPFNIEPFDTPPPLDELEMPVNILGRKNIETIIDIFQSLFGSEATLDVGTMTMLGGRAKLLPQKEIEAMTGKSESGTPMLIYQNTIYLNLDELQSRPLSEAEMLHEVAHIIIANPQAQRMMNILYRALPEETKNNISKKVSEKYSDQGLLEQAYESDAETLAGILAEIRSSGLTLEQIAQEGKKLGNDAGFNNMIKVMEKSYSSPLSFIARVIDGSFSKAVSRARTGLSGATLNGGLEQIAARLVAVSVDSVLNNQPIGLESIPLRARRARKKQSNLRHFENIETAMQTISAQGLAGYSEAHAISSAIALRRFANILPNALVSPISSADIPVKARSVPAMIPHQIDTNRFAIRDGIGWLVVADIEASEGRRPTISLREVRRANETDELGKRRMQAATQLLTYLESQYGANIAQPATEATAFDAEVKKQLLIQRSVSDSKFDPIDAYEINSSELISYAKSTQILFGDKVASPFSGVYKGELLSVFTRMANTIFADIPFEIVRTDDNVVAETLVNEEGLPQKVVLNEKNIIGIALTNPTLNEAAEQMRRIMLEERMHYMFSSHLDLRELVRQTGSRIAERIQDEYESRGYSPTAATIFSRRPELAYLEGPAAQDAIGQESLRILTSLMIYGNTTETFGFTSDSEVYELYGPIIRKLNSSPHLMSNFVSASVFAEPIDAENIAERLKEKAEQYRSAILTYENRAEAPYANELIATMAEKIASHALEKGYKTFADFSPDMDKIIPVLAKELAKNEKYGIVTQQQIEDLARMMIAQEVFRESFQATGQGRLSFQKVAHLLGETAGENISNAGRLLALWGVLLRSNPEFQYQKFYRDMHDHLLKGIKNRDLLEMASAQAGEFLLSGKASYQAAIRAIYKSGSPKISKNSLSQIIQSMKSELRKVGKLNDEQRVAEYGQAVSDLTKIYNSLPSLGLKADKQGDVIITLEKALGELRKAYTKLQKIDSLKAEQIFNARAFRAMPDPELAEAIYAVRAEAAAGLGQEEFMELLAKELRAQAQTSYEIAMRYIENLPEDEAMSQLKRLRFKGINNIEDVITELENAKRNITGDDFLWNSIGLAFDNISDKSSDGTIINSIQRQLKISFRAAKEIYELVGGRAAVSEYKQNKQNVIGEMINSLGKRIPDEIKKIVLDIILDKRITPRVEDMTADTIRDYFIRAFAQNEKILPEKTTFLEDARDLIIEAASTKSPTIRRRALRRLEELALNVKGQGVLEFLTAFRKASLTSGFRTLAISAGSSGLALIGSYAALVISKIFRTGPGKLSLKDLGAILSALPALVRNGMDVVKQALRGDYIGRQEDIIARPVLESAERGDDVRIWKNISLPKFLSKPAGWLAARMVRIPVLSDAFFSTLAADLFMLTSAVADKENAIRADITGEKPVLNSARDIIDFFFDTTSARMKPFREAAEREIEDISDPVLKRVASRDISIRMREMAMSYLNSRYITAGNVYGSAISMMRDLSGKTTGGVLGAAATILTRYKYVHTNPAQRFLLEYFIPFVTAPINSVNFMLNFTPVAFIRAGTGLSFGPFKEASIEFKGTDPEILAMMRVMGMLGTAASLALLGLAIRSLGEDDEERFFDITGGLDAFGSFARRQAAIEAGIIPYSVRLGALNFVYKDIAPHLAVIGDVLDAIKYSPGGKNTRESRRRIENALLTMAQNAPLALASMSAFEPLLKMINTTRGADARAFDAFKRELGRGAATYFSPAFLRDMQAVLDDKRYVIAPNIESQFFAGLPMSKIWGGQGKEVLYNIYGEPAIEDRTVLGRVLVNTIDKRRDAYATAIRAALEAGHSPIRNPDTTFPNPRTQDGSWNTRDVSIMRNIQTKNAMSYAREKFYAAYEKGVFENMNDSAKAIYLRSLWRHAYRYTSKKSRDEFAQRN